MTSCSVGPQALYTKVIDLILLIPGGSALFTKKGSVTGGGLILREGKGSSAGEEAEAIGLQETRNTEGIWALVQVCVSVVPGGRERTE